MIKTAICELAGIDYPIFQGGMAWISDAKLAAAVSNGGGLGIISAMNADANYLREQINIARKLTDKPFGVNVMLLSPFVDEVSMVVAEEAVPVVTTGAGNPSKFMEAWLTAGIKVIPVVASTAMAKLVTRVGAAAIIAEGGESGGHVGDTSTMALVPQVCDVTDLPVIAAGGIADGRGVAAAFMLGATGVQLGTRFLVAEECDIHPNYKDKILKASDIATIVTGKKLGHPVRSIKTPFSRAYIKAEYDSSVSDEELEAMGSGTVRMAAVEGDLEKGTFLSGQIAGMVNKTQPAAEMIVEIFNEAEAILSGASKWIQVK
ncbi:MAG: nitronate monooxygenase [Oscillospiraceae bacterium]|nr:nitronate monooxygenase [Oscillospiraceae bacterium]